MADDPTLWRAGLERPTEQDIVTARTKEFVVSDQQCCRFLDITHNELLEICEEIRAQLQATAVRTYIPLSTNPSIPPILPRKAETELTINMNGSKVMYAREGETLKLWMLNAVVKEATPDFAPIWMHLRTASDLGSTIFNYTERDKEPMYFADNAWHSTVPYRVRQNFLGWLIRAQAAEMKEDAALRQLDVNAGTRLPVYGSRAGMKRKRPWLEERYRNR